MEAAIYSARCLKAALKTTWTRTEKAWTNPAFVARFYHYVNCRER